VTLFDFEQIMVLIHSTNYSNSTLLFSDVFTPAVDVFLDPVNIFPPSLILLHTGSSLVFFDLFFFVSFSFSVIK